MWVSTMLIPLFIKYSQILLDFQLKGYPSTQQLSKCMLTELRGIPADSWECNWNKAHNIAHWCKNQVWLALWLLPNLRIHRGHLILPRSGWNDFRVTTVYLWHPQSHSGRYSIGFWRKRSKLYTSNIKNTMSDCHIVEKIFQSTPGKL